MKKIFLVVNIALFLELGCASKSEKKIVFIDSTHFVTYEYHNGNLFSEQQFEKDLKSGNEIGRGYRKEYYPNGILAKTLNYYDDTPLGTQIEYDKQGNERLIEIIFADGYKAFEMKLRDGKIIKKSGHPLHLYHNKNPIRTNDILESYYGMIVSKNIATILEFKIISPDGQSFDTTISNFTSEKYDNYIERNVFDRAGNYINIINVSLVNSNGNVLVKDEIVDTIKVIE